mgnify:CR=1 FL=1
MAESVPDEFAGTAELVGILSQITRAKLAFPNNPKIQALDRASQTVIDENLFQAVLLQLAAAQEEANKGRQSPIAQMMGNR